jgi:hypothetical protein
MLAAVLAVAVASVGCRTGAVSGDILLEERCTQCHTLAPVEVARKTRQEWEATVYRMIGKGTRLNDEEARQVIEFLSDTYGVQQP